LVCSVQHFVYTYAVAEGDLFVLFAEISGFLTKSRCTYCNRPWRTGEGRRRGRKKLDWLLTSRGAFGIISNVAGHPLV